MGEHTRAVVAIFKAKSYQKREKESKEMSLFMVSLANRWTLTLVALISLPLRETLTRVRGHALPIPALFIANCY